MGTILDQKVIDLINDEQTVKMLATVDSDGVPYAEIKQSVHLGRDGSIHLLEFHEYTITGCNLVNSIWFEHPLSIALKGIEGHCVQIKGRAIRAIVAGTVYQDYYKKVRAQYGDIELAAIWVIGVDQVTQQGIVQQPYCNAKDNGPFLHLDRIANLENSCAEV